MIFDVGLLQCVGGVGSPEVAFCEAWNVGFSISVSVGLALMPIVAVLALFGGVDR